MAAAGVARLALKLFLGWKGTRSILRPSREMLGADAHLEALRSESARLAAAARKDLEAAILSCPGWSMADLVWHTGTIVHWIGSFLRARGAGHDATLVAPEAPSDDELVTWFEEGAEGLARMLTEEDPTDTLGQQFPDGYGGPSLYRHYAREVAVHRWDAEAAVSVPDPIDDGLAADWLDDLLIAWLPNAAARGNQAQGPWEGEAVGFHRSDGPGDWLVRLTGAGIVEPTWGKGSADVMVNGSASGLLLVALNRIPLDDRRVEIVGHAEVLERWRGDIRFGRPVSGAHWLGSPRASVRGSSPG